MSNQIAFQVNRINTNVAVLNLKPREREAPWAETGWSLGLNSHILGRTDGGLHALCCRTMASKCCAPSRVKRTLVDRWNA